MTVQLHDNAGDGQGGREVARPRAAVPALAATTGHAIAPSAILMHAKSRTETGPWIVIGVVIIFLTFGLFGTWSALAKLSSTAVAPGVVAVNSDWRTLQHLESGIVAKILVHNGERVTAGQLLLRLDPTRVKAELNIIDGQLDLARATAARLTAERDGSRLIDFPDGLTTRMNQQDVATVVAGQQLLFKARRASLKGQTDILKQKISQLNEQIQGIKVQQEARKEQYDLITKELASLKELYKKGYVSRQRILQLQRAAESLKGQRGQDLASIAQAESQIGETKLQILQAQKDFREKVVDELRKVQAQIYDLEEKRVAAADQVKRIDIRAPVSGRVIGLAVHTVGGVIQPGENLLSIVPDNDMLIIKAKVKPTAIEYVRRGQPAEVRFTGLSHRTTPVLLGQVINVSADRITDRTPGSKPYYEVKIAIPPEQLKRIVGADIVPGMPAEALIQTGKRTPLGFLLGPITDNLARVMGQ